MFNETFSEVLKHEGVVSVTSWANDNAHVANTWNSYLTLAGENRILIPAAWFNRTEKNVNINSKVILTLGSHEVKGKVSMGTGFVVEGNAKFITSGEEFDMMKDKFSFMTRVLEITVDTIKQTI